MANRIDLNRLSSFIVFAREKSFTRSCSVGRDPVGPEPQHAKYPDIQLKINIGYGLIDIVAERFDAGVSIGDQIAKDMIAVRISPDFRMAVAAAPLYFEGRDKPKTPQDLAHGMARRFGAHGISAARRRALMHVSRRPL